MIMDLNKNNTKKILLIICAAILFAYLIFNFSKVILLAKWIISLIMPFIIGFAIAFILNVPMKGFENVLFKNKESRFYRMKRPVCLVLAIICILLVITFAIAMIVTEIGPTIDAIGEKFPGTMNDIKNWAIKISKNYPDVVHKIRSININWDKLVDEAISLIKSGGGNILTSTFTFASSFVGVIVDIVVGLFFAIYILSQKEELEKQTKGTLYAVFKEKTADKIIKICGTADRTFSNFISGQCLEACILGMMFFITMSIFHIPFALVVSITIALTALIPVFGAFIGCGIGAFLILVDDPRKVIMFLIVFIVLQQIEGNLIYPHVVGGSVGLPSIWVLVAVILGGNLMGVIGMLIFVPLVSVLYATFEEFVIKRIRERNIPWQKYYKAGVTPHDNQKPEKKSKKKSKAENDKEKTQQLIAKDRKKE